MTLHATPDLSRRALLQGGALTIAFALVERATPAGAQGASAAAKSLDPQAVDSYLSINADGTVTVFCGKVDLGQGLRVAIPQIAAEELGLGLDRIRYVEGDTALTPDQGRTSGSNGVQRGGMQIRRAAATARAALVELAAKRLDVAASTLTVRDGVVRTTAGGASIAFVDLLAGQRFDLKLDPKAPLKAPGSYELVGKSFPRPDVLAKCTGAPMYVQDFRLPNMAHARVIRPPAVGATLIAVDDGSIAALAGVKIVRIKDFLAVVADDEWTAVRAARALKAQWSAGTGLPEQATLVADLRAGPFHGDETIVDKGAAPATPVESARALKASYFWPMQSHASIGPSCAVADVAADRATIWTASQGTHGNRATFARFLGLPRENVRLIYLDGAGCYGMNGHEDAAADAAIVSRAVGRPVRVQWSRADELGWDPKGPPQLLDLSGAVDSSGRIVDWLTEMWIPQTTKGMPEIPLLGPAAAGLDDVRGLNPGLITINGDPPYEAGHVKVVAHWLKGTPLRPAPLRAPGKPANCFAVESFVDELAQASGLDPVEFRLRSLKDPRGLEVVRRAAAMIDWKPRAAPRETTSGIARGRGFAYIHYKHNEAYVAIAMEVAVDRASGEIAVERVVCAHDCGQIINPDGARAQVEGCILQTLSRTLMEEVAFDRARVSSTDWSTYPILRFSQAPRLQIELIDRPNAPPVGAGEAACSPVPAALANAVADATGARLRIVPFTPARVKAALKVDTRT